MAVRRGVRLAGDLRVLALDPVFAPALVPAFFDALLARRLGFEPHGLLLPLEAVAPRRDDLPDDCRGFFLPMKIRSALICVVLQRV